MKLPLCVLLLGFLTLAFPLRSQEKTDSATISFLADDKARNALLDDTQEPYFSTLQPMEMAAKTDAVLAPGTLDEQRKACRALYAKGVLNFTEAESEAISWHIAKLHPVLAKSYPAFASTAWSFLKVSDKIEGGLPHTRGHHIVFSERVCERALASRKSERENNVMGILELLIHEQTHVFQRTHPGLFDSLYTKVWGFEKMAKVPTNPWLTKHNLSNPDGVDCRWVLPVKGNGQTTHLWPLAVLEEGDGLKHLQIDFRKIAVEVRKDATGFVVITGLSGTPVRRQLEKSAEFRTLLPLSTNIYHPNEASADLFAKLVLTDAFMPAAALTPEVRERIEKSFGPLRTWFAENTKAGGPARDR